MAHTPPFSADVVGSYLRSAPLAQARADFAAGTIAWADLAEVEKAEVAKLVDAQQSTGIPVVTDGEYRRSWWHFDFFGGLDGVDLVEAESGIQFAGVQTKAITPHVSGRIGFSASHPFLDHFREIKAEAERVGLTPKFTIPAPTVLDFRLDSSHIDGSVYSSREALLDDVVQAYRDAVAAFYEAGARYLQFDDTAWAYLCSEVELEKAAARGLDVDGIADRYASLLTRVLEGRPDDLTITTHVCRGNFRSTWISSGGYEPVAKQLLVDTPYDGYFLEYDSDRAGGFEPLRFLPKGDKVVVLGLITTKDGALEDPEEIKRRIAEAAEFAPLEQLALSPQCGFASTEEGNTLTEDEQWAKVRSVVEIAAEVWG